MINTRINRLRKLMTERNIDAYIVCTNDFHGSEYVGEYFKEREYMSGFTGSAGTLLVTMREALLWTDGRYFIQAEKQLEGSNILLMKMGCEGVPGISEYLEREMEENAVIGFDARTVTSDFAMKLNRFTLSCNEDLIDLLYEKRPELPKAKVFELGLEYAGESREDKLMRLREAVKEQADMIVVTALDEIAWLLNLRGNDISCTPVFLAYMIIDMDSACLYVDKSKLNKDIQSKLEAAGVFLNDYFKIYDDLEKIEGKKVWVDEKTANYRIVTLLEKCEVVNKVSPISHFKAIKNETEIANEKIAHIKDGIAVTKFMHWIKQNAGKEYITELSAAEKLEQFRREQTNYLGPSFEPIMAYGAHGAIVHYQADEESNEKIENKGFLLSDTGGHYLEGTTDVTRTYPLSELTQEQKKHYTLVLKGHLRLANAKFLYGYTGQNLDYIAREPLFREGLNYNHGTGHGVGYLLSVHEGPNSIRIKSDAVLEEGMIMSDEPGLYIENEYGIRHENLIICKKSEKNEYGQFMEFEYLTMVPFDIDAVDFDYLTDEEIEMLKQYQELVYKNLEKYFDGEEKEWLLNKCKV